MPTQSADKFGYAELSRAKQASKAGVKRKCEKAEAEKEFLAILEKNLFLEQRHEEDWGTGLEGKTFTLDDLEVEFQDYAGVKDDETQLTSLDPLSKVVSQQPTAFKSNRLSAVNKQVCKVDKLSEKYKATQVLLLSNNYIKDLSGLQQFSCLKTLSLSNNLVTSFRSLFVVARACQRLENANFEGNQICKYPFYRSHVVSLFPTLNVLDNCPVTEKERRVAKRDVSVAQERVAEIVQNYCLTCFLAHVVDLLGVHRGIRSKAAQRGPGTPVTRASIRMLIGSWEKESHFSPDVLEQIAIHYSLEVSKVRYQLQYFCRKAGIKQDRSALWVTAFEKILSKQEAVLKDLGGRIEQFAPLDLHSPSVQLANEIVSAARSCEGQRSGTRGGFPGTRDSRATATADDGPVPIARSKGPGQPISGKAGAGFQTTGKGVGPTRRDRNGKDESHHRDRSRLRFQPIERRSPQGGLDAASKVGDAEREPLAGDIEREPLHLSLAASSSHGVLAAESDSTLDEESPPAARGRPKASGSKEESVESLLFQDIVMNEGLLSTEAAPTDASLVEELRSTIESLDKEASAAVHSADKALGDLNADIDGMILTQHTLQQEVIQKKLLESEAKNLLSLQLKENAKLQESASAIDTVLQENNDLKLQLASLQQEHKEILGQLRREREKVESFEREVRAQEEATGRLRMKENFEQRCEDLSERSLARRVLLRYCWRVRLLQKQRALYAGVRGKVLTRIRREALVCWHFVCERKREQKAFARRRLVERVSVLFEHWLDWSSWHRSRRLALLQIREKADRMLKVKVLLEWTRVAQAMVEGQKSIAYTFREFWVRKKAFAAFWNTVQKKKEKEALVRMADKHVLDRWFLRWCKWCVEMQDQREKDEEAYNFSEFWMKKRFFNRFLVLVVMNERRHIAKLIAVNHCVRRMQLSAVRSWRDKVLHQQRKKVAEEFALHSCVSRAFRGLVSNWERQMAKKAKRKKLGVIGKMIANEKNAKLRSSYFYKWLAQAKSTSVHKLEDQILEQEEIERDRRASLVASRRPSGFQTPFSQRRSSKFSAGTRDGREQQPVAGHGGQHAFFEREQAGSAGRPQRRAPLRRESMPGPNAELKDIFWEETAPHQPLDSALDDLSANILQASPHYLQVKASPTTNQMRNTGRRASAFHTPQTQTAESVRELVSLHAEISTLQNRILETLET